MAATKEQHRERNALALRLRRKGLGWPEIGRRLSNFSRKEVSLGVGWLTALTIASEGLETELKIKMGHKEGDIFLPERFWRTHKRCWNHGHPKPTYPC